MKELENKITNFAHEKGKQTIGVLENLLDYMIGYFDPTGTPNKLWRYKEEDNQKFYDMMCSYFQLMQRELKTKDWFDAWGDLFMSLITKGGNKGQFFTPPSICTLMSEITIDEEPQATQQTTFGKRVIVSDCACGSSRNLLAAMAKFEQNGWKKPYLVAEDVDYLCCKMSAVNLAVHGCFGEVVCHDTLAEPDKVRYGYIINETMYPFPTNIPSIRPCSDSNRFIGTNIRKEREKPTEREEMVFSGGSATQLTLF